MMMAPGGWTQAPRTFTLRTPTHHRIVYPQRTRCPSHDPFVKDIFLAFFLS
jgi:hypothetical protein